MYDVCYYILVIFTSSMCIQRYLPKIGVEITHLEAVNIDCFMTFLPFKKGEIRASKDSIFFRLEAESYRVQLLRVRV